MRQIICLLGKLFFIGKRKKVDLDKISSILIIRSGALGDVLMATPFIKSLRYNFKDAKISYLVGSWSAPVLQNNPYIDEIIAFDDQIIVNKNIIKVLHVLKKIKRKKFDLVFILDKSYQWNLFAFFANIKQRIGFDRKGEGFSNNINVPFNGSKYELDYNLDLQKKIKLKIIDEKMELFPSKSDSIKINKILKTINGKELIGIAPGAAKNPGQEMASKRWPRKNYLQLIKKLLEINDINEDINKIKSNKNIKKNNNNLKIILFGGNDDKEIGEFIEQNIKNKNLINLIGKTNIHQSYLLMKKCRLFITHDSGPLHIAAASGTRIIALFGPTPPIRFAPKNAVVFYKGDLKNPAYDIYGKFRENKLMENITVEEVYRKIIQILR